MHGSDVCFRKFLAAAKVYEADVLLLGGDFAGKGLVPVLRDGDELRTEIDGKELRVPADGWDQLTADINRRGFYAAQLDADELAELRQDAAALDRKFRSEIAAQAERWCRLAAERLDPAVRCIITPGNDDPVAADPVYAADERVEFPSGMVCDLGPVAMASLGVVPFTPWSTERECSEEDLAKLISELVESVPEGRQVHPELPLPAVRHRPGRRPGTRCHAQAGHPRRQAEHRAGRQPRGARRHQEVPAARLAARPYPRVARRAADRPDTVREPGQ